MGQEQFRMSLDEIKEITEAFIIESSELLDKMEKDLVTLEKFPSDRELLNGIFRVVHTIKGNSVFLGFERMQKLTHHIEDILRELRSGSLSVAKPIMDILFKSLDLIKILLNDIKSGKESQVDLDGMIKRLAEAKEAKAALPEVKIVEKREPPKEGIVKETPRVVEKTEAPKLGAVEVQETIRVEVRRLDSLMNLAGELVLARNRLVQIQKQIEMSTITEDLKDEFSNIVEQVDLITSDLQIGVMKTRMIAIDKIFSKYPRLIRDLTANAKKEIQLRISGEETELDKSIIEQINDPLVHLLRNSIDHGIEPPDVRESQRKPRRGTIWLSAEQRGDYINITVRDDGKGIDPDLIKKKAVEKGLITEEKSNAMDREEIYNLLFLPGFSTKETTSDVSGRGVGMDVVKTSIERLNGTVEIQSEIGKGTSISLRFPLTLAIIQVQLVRVGADMYAIPNIFVSEIVKIPKKQIIRIVGHNEVLKLRDQVIPLLDLQEIFEVETTSGERDWVYVVVTLMGDRKIGVIVDDVRGQEEIVIKSLGEYLKRYGECFAGATIMGDGKVILIIDLAAVWKLATGQFTITKEV